jgi:hypothetical protein
VLKETVSSFFASPATAVVATCSAAPMMKRDPCESPGAVRTGKDSNAMIAAASKRRIQDASN